MKVTVIETGSNCGIQQWPALSCYVWHLYQDIYIYTPTKASITSVLLNIDLSFLSIFSLIIKITWWAYLLLIQLERNKISRKLIRLTSPQYTKFCPLHLWDNEGWNLCMCMPAPLWSWMQVRSNTKLLLPNISSDYLVLSHHIWKTLPHKPLLANKYKV